MKEFIAENFLYLAEQNGRMARALETKKREEKRTEQSRKNDQEFFEAHAKQFENLGLQLSALHVGRMIERCKDEKQILTNGEYISLIEELGRRMRDECSLFNFLILNNEEKGWCFPSAPLFGKEVEDKIASVIADISEAGKCLGLGRSTASVFHLMRVMEVGVQQFGTKLGVALAEEKVWQTILDQLNPPIKALGKAPEAKAYAAIAAHLYNVKLAWRNETMHPKATYTPEEAEGIFGAVRLFMNELVKVL